MESTEEAVLGFPAASKTTPASTCVAAPPGGSAAPKVLEEERTTFERRNKRVEPQFPPASLRFWYASSSVGAQLKPQNTPYVPGGAPAALITKGAQNAGQV
eukprot:83313-Prorocentrum_minimum.AAC.1